MKVHLGMLLGIITASMFFSIPANAESQAKEDPAVSSESSVTIYLDGQQLQTQTSPIIVNGATLVPMRNIFEAHGANLNWDHSTKTVIATKDDTNLTYRIGESAAELNGQALDLTVPGQVQGGNTFVPLRFVSEALGSKVEWDPMTRSVQITTPREQQADKLIAYGQSFWGARYELGASPEQTDSFDCSSFVKRVFQDVLSIDLPRTSRDQALIGEEVSVDELQPGDLLFFATTESNISHVAIYAGDHQILHTSSVKYGVRMDSFSGYWTERFVTARRVF